MTHILVRTRGRIRIVEGDRFGQLQKRRFVEYRLSRTGEGGDFIVIDIFDEFNPIIDEYERKREATSIDVPAQFGQKFVQLCTEVRRELDRFGLKIFFDPPGAGGGIRPKWRYKLGGRMRTDFAEVTDGTAEECDPYESDPDVVPADIVEMVRADREYYRRKEWKDWFGRKLQRKREEVVRREALMAIKQEVREFGFGS